MKCYVVAGRFAILIAIMNGATSAFQWPHSRK